MKIEVFGLMVELIENFGEDLCWIICFVFFFLKK